MKNFKRILALVLAVMMVATSVVAISAAEADEKVVFNAEAITRLNKLGIFQGYNPEDMGENDNVTRAQMALFTGRVLTGKVESNYWESYVNDTTFEDIDDIADYYVGAISYAYENGVVIGKSDVAFDPNGNVTYQEALTMVVRSLGYTGLSYPNGFINKAMKLGLTNGIANVAYGDAAIRGVIATILYNALYAEDSLFADNFNLTSGTYMLVATPTVEIGDEKIAGARINGYVGETVNEGYVAFAPIGDDYKAVNRKAEYVYAKTTQIADDLKGKQIKENYADKLGYAFNLTFEDDVLTWGDECETKTFVNYGDDREITATPIDYDHHKNAVGVDICKTNWYLTFGDQTYNLVDGYDKDYTAPTGTHDLILYADYGSYGIKVDTYEQCFDKYGNIIDENDEVLLHYIDGAYYKDMAPCEYKADGTGAATPADCNVKKVKATSAQIMAAIAHYEDSAQSDYAIVENGAVIGTNDTFGGSAVLGVDNNRDAVIAIAKNYFCEITAMDYDNDGIYDAAIYTPYYLGYVNGNVQDQDDNTYDGSEFQLTGITDHTGTKNLLSGFSNAKDIPDVNDYKFTGKVDKPTSWQWYVYSYNRHTNEINVKEVAKSVSGKVEWGVKGAVNPYTYIYDEAQVSIGGTVYQVGGWDYDNLLGLKAVRRFDAGQIKQKHVNFVGYDVNGDGKINADDVSMSYYNGWNDILEFGMTDDCAGFKGYAVAGHLIHGVPTLSNVTSKYVIFNAYQSEFAIEDNQIIVDAIIDTTGEYKTIKINSVNSMEFTDIEFLIFQQYCDILYSTASSLMDKYAYFFDATRLAFHQATPLYKAVERAYIIERLTDTFVDWDAFDGDFAEHLFLNDHVTLIYGVEAVAEDGAYQLITNDIDKLHNGSYIDNGVFAPSGTSEGNKWGYMEPDYDADLDKDTTVSGDDHEIAHAVAPITFKYGVSSTGIKQGSNTPIRTTADTVFTFVAKDGIFTYVGMPKDGYAIDLTPSTDRVYAADAKNIMIVDITRCISEIALGDVTWAERVQDITLVHEGATVADSLISLCTCYDGELMRFGDNPNRCDVMEHNHVDTWAFREYIPYVATAFQHDEVYLVTEKTSNAKIYNVDNEMYYEYKGLYNMITCEYEDSVIFTGAEVAVFQSVLFYEGFVDAQGANFVDVATNYGCIITRDDVHGVNAFVRANAANTGYVDTVGGNNALFNIQDSFGNYTGLMLGEYCGVTKDNTGAIAVVTMDNVYQNGVNIGRQHYTVNKYELITVDYVVNADGEIVDTVAYDIPVVTVAENGTTAVKNRHGSYYKVTNENGVDFYSDAAVYFTYDAITGTLTGYAFNVVVDAGGAIR